MAIELPPDELEKLGQHVLSVLRGCKERQLRDGARYLRDKRTAEHDRHVAWAHVEHLGEELIKHQLELHRLTSAVEELTEENAALRRANRALEQAQSSKGKLAAFRRFLTGEDK